MSESSVIEELARVLMPVLERQKATQYGVTFKHNAGSTPQATGYSHGPGGMLTFPGVDPVVFNTTMGATSIIAQLPTMPSVYTNPTYFTVTGVRGDTGSEKENVCDDAPVAGLMKGCLTTSVFGRYERATPILELNRLGQRVDRADPLDLRLVGSPISSARGPFLTGGVGDAPTDVLTNEISRKFWERNVSFYRLLSQQIWAGNPTNNAAGGGYKEMTGLQALVNTGYVDAETGVACPAVDSYVRSFNHGRFDNATDATNLVRAITDLYYQVKRNAQMAGVMPVRWAFAMRSQMFYELTAIWPCSYLSFRCATSIVSPAMVGQIDATDAIRLRDEMRAGSYLLVDGDRIDVILDDAIPETSNTNDQNVPSGCFASDIYLLPFSVVGGTSVLFMEYFEYSNPSLMDALGNMILGRVEGAFITWPKQINQCIQWQSKIEPRLVLRTPWLAARLQDVVYCPVQHEREPFPTDPYFVNGGKVSRSGPSFYSVWQSRG